jgi:hypothetical protein
MATCTRVAPTSAGDASGEFQTLLTGCNFGTLPVVDKVTGAARNWHCCRFSFKYAVCLRNWYKQIFSSERIYLSLMSKHNSGSALFWLHCIGYKSVLVNDVNYSFFPSHKRCCWELSHPRYLVRHLPIYYNRTAQLVPFYKSGFPYIYFKCNMESIRICVKLVVAQL